MPMKPIPPPSGFAEVIKDNRTWRNLKTAKALGLDPPIQLLARTDEVSVRADRRHLDLEHFRSAPRTWAPV
jgi:hypothetical protein